MRGCFMNRAIGQLAAVVEERGAAGAVGAEEPAVYRPPAQQPGCTELP
jgi:hypothetical protein